MSIVNQFLETNILPVMRVDILSTGVGYLQSMTQIDPVILNIGPLALRWYGVMYLVALGIAYVLGNIRCRQPNASITAQGFSDLIFILFMGAVLGGRIGYVVFYNFSTFLANPLFLVGWTGNSIELAGMSFHGGLLGVLIATYYYARKHQLSFWALTDFIAPLIPLGLFFGRMGNFINGELWGRVTEVPWGIVFKYAEPLGVPRHPSQLYEAFLEGIVLFVILWVYSCHPRPRYVVSGLFLMGYGSFRFFVEFFREPDAHLGFVALDWLSMGMLLSLPMVIIGAGLFYYGHKIAR